MNFPILGQFDFYGREGFPTMRKILKWFDNFWYHYKWIIIISSFFAAIFAIGIYQIATRSEYDLKIVYAGPSVLIDDEKSDGIKSAFAGFIEKDITGDGKKTVLLHSYSIVSDKQLEELRDEAKKDNDFVYYDVSLRDDAVSSISTLLVTGEASICLFDEYVYTKFSDEDLFVPLSEILGYKPDYAVDDYAVKLSDTGFGKYFTALDAIDGDTLICVRKLSYLSGAGKSESSKKEHELAVETFRQILEFESPN